MPRPRHPLAVLLASACALGLTLAPVPAAAHEADPRIVTVLDEVAPALPDGVVVQARAGVAAQLVADNPTSTVLEVLATGGEPFLRLSAAGVQANLASPDFFRTSNPFGVTAAVPEAARPGAEPRWVQISAGTSWGWYDHRLHPADLAAPGDGEREARLARWTVPFRYGDRPVQARGSVRFAPQLGTFLVTAGPGPAGVVVQALPGKLPGLFVSNPDRVPLTVLGRDGEPFVRFGPAGVEVNVASRTHVEDRQARGLAVEPPSPTPRFELVDAGGTSYTWLDARLRYPEDLPSGEVLRAATPTVVDTWEVPVTTVQGPTAFAGEIRWVPEASGAQQPRSAPPVEPRRSALLPAAVGIGALAVVGVVVVRLRRRTRGSSSSSQRL